MFALLEQVLLGRVPCESPAIVAVVCARVAGVLLFFCLLWILLKAPVSAEESPDSHSGTLSRLDRADLVELIGNVMRREIASHSSGAAGASHSGGEFRDGAPG